ncbi:MAG TPA: hypothetical protein VMZ04_10040 [Anaerolineae bacterium]|nr:hypothetical protein [Anaerolineae bacterium]
MAGMTAQDKKWQAQEDAHTLSRVNEITSNKARLAAAQKAANTMLVESKQRVASLQKVASVKPKAVVKSAVPKKVAKRTVSKK